MSLRAYKCSLLRIELRHLGCPASFLVAILVLVQQTARKLSICRKRRGNNEASSDIGAKALDSDLAKK